MKQKNLIKSLYKACLNKDVKAMMELRQEEFRKILKRRLMGKSFDNRWTLVRI